jgi:hypothetical protein
MPRTDPSTRHWRPAHALLLAGAFAVLAAGCSTLAAVAGLLNNQLVLGAPQLQSYVDRRFPKDYARGPVTLTLLNPRVSLPANDNRLRLDLDIGFRGFGSDGSSPVGRIGVASGLRYDANTRGLHLANPSLEMLDIPKLGGALNDTGRDLVNRWLQDQAQDDPVYRIEDKVFETLGPGRTVESTTIGNGQVVVQFSE